MACRNIEKAEKAQHAIQQAVSAASTSILELDVSSLASVHEFSRQFSQANGDLDLLINNAGIVAIPLSRNSDNHELQVATNYLGAFALTGLLLPFFCKIRPARIVNVGSLAHRFGKLNVDNLNWEEDEYDQWKAYANSKVAMLSFTLELNRRLQNDPNRSNIIALGAHPGFANTNIHQGSAALTHVGPVRKWIRSRAEKFVPTAREAARPIILAADGNNVSGGDYYGPGGFLEIGGKPAAAKLNPVTRNTELAGALWKASEALTGVSYN